MSRLRVYVVAVALAVLALPLVADAADTDRYTVSITPSAVQPSSSASYAIVFKSHPQSINKANAAHIAIPPGFSIDTPPVATTTCSIVPWVASVDLLTSRIDLVSLPGGELCPNGRLTVTFLATSPASEGSYEWQTELSGSAGQFALDQAAQPTVSVDGTPPAITLTNRPSDPSGDPSAVFGFSANEVVNGFQCSLDGAPFSACSSGVAYGPLGDGGHSFAVRATDLAGNTSSAVAYTWTIDATAPPSPVLTDVPQDPSGSSTASFSFLDADSTASFRCQLDAGGFSACSSPKAYSGIGDGSHTFAVKAVDPIGHESGVTTYTWTVDTVHPVVTLTDKPPLLTNQTTASFSFVSNKPNSNYQCKLDGGSFGNCTSPRLYTGLGDGPHTFSVRAAALGNLGLTTEYTWIIDTVAPDTAITTTPPALSTSGSANFTFTSSEAGSRFACALDASGTTSCDSPKTFSGLGDGTHTFRVQAVDAAGNVDATPASYSWQITGVGPGTTDTTPPGNVRRLKRNVRYGSLVLSWVRPSDSDFDHVEVFASTSARSLPRTPVYKGRAGRYTNKRFKNGLYYRYVVVSYDHAGNASRGSGAVVPPSILLRSPADARRVHGPPLLVWARVAKATYYNVQLYYGPRKILSAWPNRAQLKLSRSWLYSGRHFQLRKGLYRWYVWPAFGPRTKARYGQLLGQATFRVR